MQIKGKYCHHKKITITEESEYSLLAGDEFLWQRVVAKLPMSHNYIIHDDWQTIKYDTDGSKPATQPDTSYGHLMPYPVISFTAISTVITQGVSSVNWYVGMKGVCEENATGFSYVCVVLLDNCFTHFYMQC